MIRIDHVNIVVSDMERSVRFYTEALGLRRGFQTVLEGEWVERVTGLAGVKAPCVFMETDDPNVRLELLQYVSPDGALVNVNSLPNTAGLRHLAFTLPGTDALQELADRLRASGVTLVSDPVKVPFKVGNLGHKHLFYFLDPDGTVIEAAAYEASDGVAE